MGWGMSKASISSISKSVSSGITPLRSNSKFWNNPLIPWLKTNQLGEKYIYDTVEKVSEKALEETSLKLNPVNTLSIAMYGEGRTRGNVSVLKAEMATNQACCNIVINEDKAHYEYVYYFLKTQYNYLRNLSSGVRKNLNSNDIKNFEIRLPENIIIQKKIAKALSTLDKKIALNNRINTELEAMAKTLYDYWFVQFDFPISEAQANALGKPELKGKPYKTSGGKMVFNEALKREIPQGWGVEELNDCVETILDHRGKTPKKLGGDWTGNNDGILAISAKLVKAGKLVNLEKANKVDYALYEKWMPEKLKDGDILMTSEAPAGEFYFIYGKTDYCMSQRLFAIRANPLLVCPTYLYYELSKGHGYSQILGSLSGSTVFGIRQDVLRTIKVVIPELKLQQRFNQIVISQLKQVKSLDQENQQLTKLRDWLLPMLMNGQVTVK